MKIRILAIDRMRERYLAEAAGDFATRLRRYVPLEIVDLGASHGGSPERAMREEGERILRVVEPAERLWLLERTGDELDSVALARRLEAYAGDGTARLSIAVAGTYGASPALLERADFCWSLSRLTLLHEWARALALEQLYRATKISRNEPYHH